MPAPRGISLFDILRSGGTDVALIGSYNVYFPFFEEVVLPRLAIGGCSRVVLMMDSGQFSASFSDPSSAPRLAGRAYAILPLSAPGAFHPKFFLLAGRQRTRLLVGSHNVTISGFGLNQEITTLFDTAAENVPRQPFQETWRFATSWAARAGADSRKLLKPVESVAPWLNDAPRGPNADETFVMGSLADRGLWDALRPHLPNKVESITVLGPSFDQRLDFLKTLTREMKPRSIAVGVDPASSSVTHEAAKRFPDIRFTDLSKGDWKGSHPSVHAKVILLSQKDGSGLLVSGSANPSRQAWNADAGERNAELVVVRRLRKGDRLPDELRLRAIAKLPLVSKEAWKEIAGRLEAEATSRAAASPGIEIAIPCDDGFLVSRAFVDGLNESAVQLRDVADEIHRSRPFLFRGDRALVRPSDPERRHAIVRIEARHSKRVLVALVQRVDELAEAPQDEAHRAIESALSGLKVDASQLEQLLTLMERVILEEPRDIGGRQSPGAPVSGPRPPEASKVGDGGLGVPLSDGGRYRRLRAEATGSDLLSALNLFIFKLGPPPTPPRPAGPAGGPGASGGTHPPPATASGLGVVMAEQCRLRLRKLVSRLIGRLEGAAQDPDGDGASLAVGRLVTALLLIRHLDANAHTFAWKPAFEDLVDDSVRIDLFLAGTRLLFGRRPGLASRALDESANRTLLELSSARALLCWLGLALKIDLSVPSKMTEKDEENPDQIAENLDKRALLLLALCEVAEDAESLRLFKTLIEPDRERAEWADRHLKMASRLLDAAGKARSLPVPTDLRAGEIVVQYQVVGNPFSVVLWATAQKAGIVDLGGEKTAKQVVVASIRRVSIPLWNPLRRSSLRFQPTPPAPRDRRAALQRSKLPGQLPRPRGR